MNIALLYKGSFFSVLCVGDTCVFQQVPELEELG